MSVLSKRCHLEFLGQGYDPATERYMNSQVLSDPEMSEYRRVKVGSKEMRLPNNVRVVGTSNGNQTKFGRYTFYTKEDYQNAVHMRYGLDVGIPLFVRVGVEGRWIETEMENEDKALLRFHLERETAKLMIRNIAQVDHQRKFWDALGELPNVYNPQTEPDFQQFILKYGTHIVTKVSVGGCAYVDCLVSNSYITKRKLEEIAVQVGGIFENLEVGAHGKVAEHKQNIKRMGVSIVKVLFRGGTTNNLAALTYDDFNNWLQSVDQNPVEISHTVELEAFYNFVNGRKSAALREATEKYLANTIAENERRLREEERRRKEEKREKKRQQEIEEKRRQRESEEKRRRQEAEDRAEAEYAMCFYPFSYP